jgi:hypothetical chaperone protein
MQHSQHSTTALGLDFGTTNSAVALAVAGQPPRLARFPTAAGETETFRSILFFEGGRPRHRNAETAFAGPSAIEHYLEASHKGRFLQSLKAYLGDASFTGTIVGGRQRTLESLIALILQKLLAGATASLGPLPDRVVVGRPVHFTDARSAGDDALALSRLRTALQLAGITDPVFEFEPVAAAYAYQQSIGKPETVRIADFGGGTSDFSLLSLTPNAATHAGEIQILGNDGLAFAGDVFDRAIVRHAVAPRLGKGSHYVSWPDKQLPMPDWVYAKLERWHYLSFLKSSTTIEMIERVQSTSDAPQEIAALLNLIDGDLGYELHAHVNRTKMELSSASHSEFHFDLFPIAIDWHATRTEFTDWIQPQLDGIAATVDALLAASAVTPDAVDRVFLTGGSSFVPAVRDIFSRTFGLDKLAGGNELTSVATGLALRGLARPNTAG